MDVEDPNENKGEDPSMFLTGEAYQESLLKKEQMELHQPTENE